jgi:hypothetical protein
MLVLIVDVQLEPLHRQGAHRQRCISALPGEFPADQVLLIDSVRRLPFQKLDHIIDLLSALERNQTMQVLHLNIQSLAMDIVLL